MIEPEPPHVEVEAVGAPKRRIVAVVVAIGAVLSVALLKPWDLLPAPRPTAVPLVAVQPTPLIGQPTLEIASPSPSAVPAPPTVPADVAAARGRMLCGSQTQWRLLTMESGELGTSRTVYSAKPIAASGPDDQAIPIVRVAAGQLLGIGVCRPEQRDEQDIGQPVSGVVIWEFSGGGSSSSVAQVASLDSALDRVGEAYYGLQAAEDGPSTGSPLAWSPGRYVIQIATDNVNDRGLWFALEFITIQRSDKRAD